MTKMEMRASFQWILAKKTMWCQQHLLWTEDRTSRAANVSEKCGNTAQFEIPNYDEISRMSKGNFKIENLEANWAAFYSKTIRRSMKIKLFQLSQNIHPVQGQIVDIYHNYLLKSLIRPCSFHIFVGGALSILVIYVLRCGDMSCREVSGLSLGWDHDAAFHKYLNAWIRILVNHYILKARCSVFICCLSPHSIAPLFNCLYELFQL